MNFRKYLTVAAVSAVLIVPGLSAPAYAQALPAAITAAITACGTDVACIAGIAAANPALAAQIAAAAATVNPALAAQIAAAVSAAVPDAADQVAAAVTATQGGTDTAASPN